MVRGGLTDKDREWMKGEVQYKNQQTETTKRRRIRERIVQSLKDFELIARELPDEERRKIFEQLDEESESHCVEEVSYIIPKAVPTNVEDNRCSESGAERAQEPADDSARPRRLHVQQEY